MSLYKTYKKLLNSSTGLRPLGNVPRATTHIHIQDISNLRLTEGNRHKRNKDHSRIAIIPSPSLLPFIKK